MSRFIADREARVETIEHVLDLMRHAGGPPDKQSPETIVPHSNGYSCWFIGNAQIGTAALTASEIADRIERAAAAKA